MFLLLCIRLSFNGYSGIPWQRRWSVKTADVRTCAEKLKISAVNCNVALRVACPCCFVCVCVFCDSFLCSISLLGIS